MTWRKHDHCTYTTPAGLRCSAIVRRAHRDGTVTVEARHILTPSGTMSGCYLGYKYRVPATELRSVS